MKKSLFSIKRLITPEKHELWYEFLTDDEKLTANRKDPLRVETTRDEEHLIWL